MGYNNWVLRHYGTLNDLTYCDDDAEDFYNALLSKDGWSTSNIIKLTNSEATKSEILSAIEWLRTNEKAGDEVVFFYSGHGTNINFDIDGDGERKDEAIIPYECQAGYFIWDGQLKNEFSDFDSKRIMYYFDSCYSGGMTDLKGDGRLVLMACSETQLSLESSAWQNGQFTYYFVDQGLSSPSLFADSNHDQKVTFEEAFDYAKANCQRQTPTASDGFTNDMLP